MADIKEFIVAKKADDTDPWPVGTALLVIEKMSEDNWQESTVFCKIGPNAWECQGEVTPWGDLYAAFRRNGATILQVKSVLVVEDIDAGPQTAKRGRPAGKKSAQKAAEPVLTRGQKAAATRARNKAAKAAEKAPEPLKFKTARKG